MYNILEIKVLREMSWLLFVGLLGPRETFFGGVIEVEGAQMDGGA